MQVDGLRVDCSCGWSFTGHTRTAAMTRARQHGWTRLLINPRHTPSHTQCGADLQ